MTSWTMVPEPCLLSQQFSNQFLSHSNLLIDVTKYGNVYECQRSAAADTSSSLGLAITVPVMFMSTVTTSWS